MSKTLLLIVCENVQLIFEKSEDGTIAPKPQIICPLESISMFSVPGYFSFSVYVSLTGVDIEKSYVYVTVCSPNGDEINRTNNVPLPKELKSSDSAKFSFDFRNFTFKECGEYTVKLFVNEELAKKTTFMVTAKERGE